MKRKLIWLVQLLLLSYGTVMAQMEMQVTLTRASAAPFPTSAMAYYNNPMNYFNLTITPVDGRAHDVFISMTISSDATPTLIWTDERYAGSIPKISIPSMGKRIGSVEFVQHFNRRLNTNLSESYRGVSDLTLPEGTYHICVDIHDYYDTASVIGHSCLDFDICYSGLAPELTSPHLTSSTSGGYDKLVPSKKTNFAWTGVVSNCFEPNAFNYIIQFVAVYPGQNVQEAVESNPVLAALDCGRRTFFTYDYQTNPYLRLDSGGVYAVIVEAVPSDADRIVNLSNEGKSQYMVFVWCGPNTSGLGGGATASGGGGSGSTTGNGDGVSDTKLTMRDNQSEVLRTLRKPNIVQPRPFSTVEDVNAPFDIVASPVSGDSVNASDYVISLYEYVGDTSISMSRPPLKQATLTNVSAHDGTPITMVSDWSADLVKGTRYLVSIKSDVAYRYNNTYRVQRVDFIDRFPEINRYDSVVGMVGHTEMTSVVVFQWGAGMDEYNVLTPAQILTIGRTVCDSARVRVNKSTLHRIVWKAAMFDGSQSDLIVYDIYVMDAENAGGVVYEKTGVGETNLNADEMLSRLSVGHTYSIYVRARMYYDEVGTENGVDSRVVNFVLVSMSNESSFNQNEEQLPMLRLKEGLLFEAEEEYPYQMRGRTAMAPTPLMACLPVAKTTPDSVVVVFSTGGSDVQGNPNKIGFYRGFKSDRLVDKAKGNVTKATVSAQLDMFTIEGELSQLPSGGWGGPAKVTVMDGVSATMNVGFGTARDNSGQPYDWWYIYGGEQYDESKAAGALTVGGFGGVFAHNMTINNAAYLSKSPKDLVADAYSGVRFTPQKNSWVAKGGVSMSLDNKNLLDAFGTIVLALENGHFSRLYVDMGDGKLSDSNPLMESDIQNVFVYEVTSECHLLNLMQLPRGVRCEFKYNGVADDGRVENVGFVKLKGVGDSDVRTIISKPLPMSLAIETWRNGGQARWGAKIGGKYGTEVELGDERVVRNLGQTAGNRGQADPYKFDKSLLSALPNAAKSEAMQPKTATVVESRMGEKSPAGALVMNGTVETPLTSQSSRSGMNEALLTCLLGTRVDFAGWHGDVDIAQSVIAAEAALDNDYVVTSVRPSSEMPIATCRENFSFFDNVEFTDADENTGVVSPFAKCLFTTAYPVSYVKQRSKPVVNEILVADAEKGARSFCLALGKPHTAASARLNYSYDDNSDRRIAADGQGGGFAPGSRNIITLNANMYEKRYGSASSTDRAIDISTGEEQLSMKSDELGWRLPLCGGRPSQSCVERTIEVQTHEAPYTLANQVLFTWPYNGDPFVPNEEIDSACYIFFKQDRDDLFDGYSLGRKGKVLRAFAVNQEMGNSKAVECRYFYFPTRVAGKDAVPYVKVYVPKSLFKVKNAAGTYSPCHVSLLVVDTAEYASAYKESGRKAAYSSEAFSEYTVCRQVGSQVYDLYFRLDHMYPTYKKLMETIADESAQTGVGIGYGADKVTVDASNAVITSKLSTINLNRYFAFRNRSYLFDSYRPNDPAQYATGVTLPPIAAMAVNGRETIDDYYNSLIPEWLAVHESFYYQYAHLLYYQQRARWVTIGKYPVQYNTEIGITDLSMLAPASMRVLESNGLYVSMSESELADMFANGTLVNRGTLSASRSSWSHEGMQVRQPVDWNMPALIQVSSDLLNRVNETHFNSTAHIKSVAFVKSNPEICIQDRVSPGVMKENNVFASFFSQLRSYAEWYAGLDEKERGEVRESLTEYGGEGNMLPHVKTQYLTMDDAPFAIPKASLLTAYDSWSNEKTRYKSRDYWFDNWVRSNATESYPGIRPQWTSPWIVSDYSPANTEHYRQARRRTEYRQYVANPYYLSLNSGEESFLGSVFAICREVAGNGQSTLHHNALSDARIAIHVPYNKVVKNYLSIKK